MVDPERAKFLKDINADSPLELVIRAHLWVEARMIELLSDLVPFPDRIDFDRFTFPQKVALVAAHGAMGKEDVPAYLKLNSMRNKIAHRLDGALTAEDEAALINCLSTSLRQVAKVGDPEVAGKPWPHTLRYVLATLVASLHVRHQALQRARDEGRKLALEVSNLTSELQEEREQREALSSGTAGPSVPPARPHSTHDKGPGQTVKEPTDV